jgi:hypothetical protein
MIVVKLQGGLGNQLFQYAFGRAVSLHYQQPLYFDMKFLLDRSPRENFVFRDYDLDLFDLPEVKFYNSERNSLIEKTKQFFGIKQITYFNEKSFSFDPTVFELNKKHLYFDGYWQSPKYFEENSELLKKEFVLKNKLTIHQQQLLVQIQQDESVCINFRRTDFVTIDSAISHHGVPPLTFYYESVRKIKALKENSKLKFYIFSDDIEWCRHNFKLEDDLIFVTHDLYKGERFSSYMQLMIACKNFIIPNSTFAWWAAWLSTTENKLVISPKQWFADTAIQSQTNDLRPLEWIQL